MDAGPPTILIVEDDAAIREFVALALTEEGYLVQTAADGLEAMQAVASHVPALILLDILMPVMDGFEFAQSFRAQYGELCPIVVVAATRAQERAEQIGAAAYLEKPFNLCDLLAVVARYCPNATELPPRAPRQSECPV